MSALEKLLQEVRACHFCEGLPLGPKPILQVGSSKARLLITGQAPGTLAHESGITFNDPSGDRLREWLQIDRQMFYNDALIAIVPMGFCYPGKGKNGGDLPPRKECAPRWRDKILQQLPELKLTLLVGSYAQNYILGKGTVTDRVKNYKDYLPDFFPLPHPSWRTLAWAKKNPYFQEDILFALRQKVKEILK
ncbi:uracil-DNA glycosylase family protein [Commensalibacter papalotli (ex Servin-Garciduenas et al. 2014)]|uniref:Uracil-DNA glycosylase n=1 Tax=Commensalibacter papalotli (ex Servin-Garciduenas et al. 2014) TaxID=1208583 RepID=W7DZ82_9PROT|nr:uracil-DNA glycosylase family protein [Commensalibacter papalotli (ex Servin-Garciduenas et al. 2014)]EUK18014.1 uracil-DNA glycosylase [Commensalibacter papalotli (ex Servin-Garciduenas et al. 2014)]